MSGNGAAGDLAARLRELRARHPKLAVTTELLRLDDSLATFRAVVAVDGVPRANGHAARAAERTGGFVAAAEAAAVAQALLLGGFDTPSESLPTRDAQGERRTRRTTEATPEAGAAAPEPDAAPVPAELATPRSRKGTRPAIAEAPPSTPPRATAPVPPEPQEQPSVAAPPEAAAASPPPRRASGARSRRQQTPAVQDGASPTGDVAEAAHQPALLVEAATPTPSASARRSRRAPMIAPEPARPAAEAVGAGAPSTNSSEPATLERLQEAWRPGQPIPAWWPPAREANPKRLSQPQIARLRTQGEAAGLTGEQLDRYCQLLFHRGLPELAHWQAAVLTTRLDPRFPNPVEEVRAGRILHTLAVGDFVPIADGQVGFVRWGDIAGDQEPPR